MIRQHEILNLSLVSLLLDIGKWNRPRWDAAHVSGLTGNPYDEWVCRNEAQ